MRALVRSTSVQVPVRESASPRAPSAALSVVRGSRLEVARSALTDWIERARQRIEQVNERIERNEERLRRVRDFLEGRRIAQSRPHRSAPQAPARAVRGAAERAPRERDAS